jgi:hypothetical protein
MAADTKIDGVQRMVKGSDLLVRTLEELGVKSIYRVPGEENLDMGLRRIRTSGNQFVQSNGVAIRLKSINWFGAEGENYTPHGTWGRSWRGVIDQIKQLGFNRIRLPFSGYMSTSNPVPPSSVISASANPDLLGLTALQIFDKIIDYCLASEIYVVLDHRRRTAGVGADGSPVGRRRQSPGTGEPPMSAALDAIPSMIDRIRHDLVGLKMPRALEALDHVVRRLEHAELSALEAIHILLSEELTLRENSRIKTALRMGRLATIKTLAGFDFTFRLSLDRDRIFTLAQLGFVDRHEAVHFLGPPGTGKSHLATALGVEAVKAGKSVYFTTLADLIGGRLPVPNGKVGSRSAFASSAGRAC